MSATPLRDKLVQWEHDLFAAAWKSGKSYPVARTEVALAVNQYEEQALARLALFDELVAVAKAQHGAIDTLMARLIGLDAQFRPSKSGEPWQALLLGNAVLVKAEAIEKEAKG